MLFVEELCRIRGVGENAADLAGHEKHVLGWLTLNHSLTAAVIAEVELAAPHEQRLLYPPE